VQKMDQLLGGAFTLLSDPGLEAISAYDMEHQMGGSIMGNMGYVIIDKSGRIREHVINPLFGRHASDIIESLKELQ
jgi:peroxiredoxin